MTNWPIDDERDTMRLLFQQWKVVYGQQEFLSLLVRIIATEECRSMQSVLLKIELQW